MVAIMVFIIPLDSSKGFHFLDAATIYPLPEPDVDVGGLLVLALRPARPPTCRLWYSSGRSISTHLLTELQGDYRRTPLTRLRGDISRSSGRRRATGRGARYRQ